MNFVDLGQQDFHEALAIQEQTVQSIWRDGSAETVHFVEHPPVYTIGRAGRPSNLIRERDPLGNKIELVEINRGGDVTFHGPGQLVCYPHLDLRLRGRDVHRYLRALEDVLIQTAASFGVEAFQRPGLTGIWTKEGKLASIGVGVRHWITMHGFALNVDPDLRYFSTIHACGIEDCPIASIRQLTDRNALVSDVIPIVAEAIKQRFTSADTAESKDPRERAM